MVPLIFDRVSFALPDGTELLHSVAFSVGSGAVTVLAGPSGAGKSTLLRLGNRLEVPSGGVVRLQGVDIATVDPLQLRRRVGMVFQRPTPFAGTISENLAAASPATSIELRQDMLQRVGLDPQMIDRIADDLSGGEAQRMCIARTLLTEPEVILMDEPTSSLDPENRRGIEHLVRELAEGGASILWVSHDLAQVERIADEVVVLLDGRNASTANAEAFLRSGDGGGSL